MKKSINIILLLLMLTIVFVPDAKAILQYGLMQLGLFQPKIEKEIISNQKFSVNFVNTKTSQVISNDDLKNKVVFINFWATWCSPCITEMSSIDNLMSKFKNNSDIVIMIVDVDANPEKSNALLRKKEWNLTNYMVKETIPQIWFSGSLPTTIVLDKSGNLVYQSQRLADYSNKNFEKFLLNLSQQ